jgi:hypothetical protein
MTSINIKPRIISSTDTLCKMYFQNSINKSNDSKGFDLPLIHIKL